MWIGADLHAQEFRPLLFAPAAAESEEEALFGRVAVDALPFLAGLIVGDHVLEGHERDAGAAIIGGVFTEREAAVELHVVDGNEVGIFIGHATDALLEFLAVLLGPPVAEIAGGIEFATLIVETVREFVTNHQADAAEVDGVVHGLIEKRRLQNAGGKDDFVIGTAIVSVDFGRRHAPFLAVKRLADLGDLIVGLDSD